MILDLEVLRDRLRAALPQLTYETVELMHSETRVRHPALAITAPERVKGHVYRMTIAVIGDLVNFFVHTHGASKEYTTEGTQRFHKKCESVDEVFAIACAAMTGTRPS